MGIFGAGWDVVYKAIQSLIPICFSMAVEAVTAQPLAMAFLLKDSRLKAGLIVIISAFWHGNNTGTARDMTKAVANFQHLYVQKYRMNI